VSTQTLTAADLHIIFAIDANGKGDRAGAYVRLWQLTGSQEALRQARISSFSGGDGGASFGANLKLQQELGEKYPGVFALSEQIFQSSLKNVGDNLDQINAGKADIDELMFRGAEAAWASAELPNGKTLPMTHDFPGNLFALNPWSSNWLNGLQFSHGSEVAAEGAFEAILYGKQPSDFAGLPGYSMHVVKDCSGQSLLTIKDERTGKTVYVGTGGSKEQMGTDIGLIEVPLDSPLSLVLEIERQHFERLRQNEEPGSISIDEKGHIKIIAPAGGSDGQTLVQKLRQNATRARENAAQKPVPPAMRLHRQVQKLSQAGRSFAPIASIKNLSSSSAKQGAAVADLASFLGMALARQVMGGLGVAGQAGAGAVTPLMALHKAAMAVGGGGGVSPGMRAALGGLAPPGRAGGKAGAFGQQVSSARTAYAGSVAAALRRLAGDGAVLACGGSGGAGGLPSIAPRRGAGAATAMATRAASDGVGTILGAVARGQMTRGLAPRTVGREATGSAVAGPHVARSKAAEQQDVARAIQAYLEGQARLPPASGAGFDPRLTPAWAGLQLPG